ncbi:MAG: DUF2098 family protein [Methanobacterium sp.]
MKALDVNGKEIKKGKYVKYVRTHTFGIVDKIVINEKTVWIKLNSTGLLYKSDYIEIVENLNGLKSKKFIKRRLRSDKFKVRKPTQITDPEDGPGYGGG